MSLLMGGIVSQLHCYHVTGLRAKEESRGEREAEGDSCV